MANVNDYNSADLVSGVENVSGKKGKYIAGITAGVLAVVAGGSTAAYMCSDFVKNQVNLRVMKPQSYYSWVNVKNAKDTAKSAGEGYRSFVSSVGAGSSGNIDLEFEVDDAAKELIIDEVFGGENEYMKEIIDVIKNIDTLSVKCSTASKKGVSETDCEVDLNGNKLATVNVASDTNTSDTFFRIEELTSKWAVYTLPEGDSNESQEKIMNTYKEFLSNPESVLSAEEFEDLVERYVGIWNKDVEDVTVEKKEKVDICDISVDYTVMSIDMTNELADKIAEDFINEAKDDAVIKKIVIDKMGLCTEEEYTEKLDEALESLTDESDDNEKVVTIKTYVDPAGTIRGVTFSSSDDSEEGGFLLGKDGDNLRGRIYDSKDGEAVYNAELSATENGGKYTGVINIDSENGTGSVEFSDIEQVSKDKCFCNGNIKVYIGEEPVSIDLSADANSQNISSDINVDGTRYGKFTLSVRNEEGGSPELPDKSDAFVIDPENDDLSIKDYVSEEDAQKFLSDLFRNIGFKSETADTYSKSFTSVIYMDYSSMYSSISPDYDYSDFDYSAFDYSDLEGLDFDDSDFSFDFDSDDLVLN